MPKQTYRVTGDSTVAGHEKGDTFQYEFTPEQEAALVEGGHIELVKGKRGTSTGSKEQGGEK